MTLLAVAVRGRGVVAADEPVLHADDQGFLRGRAAFETARVYAGRPFRLADHLERLAASAERIGLPPLDGLEELAAQALAAAGEDEAVLRLYWTAGREDTDEPTGLALVSSLPPGLDERRTQGLKLASIPLAMEAAERTDAPWMLGGVKSTSYAVNMAAEAEAKRRGADDAVFLGQGDVVLEGPVTNVWWRRDRTLFTPGARPGDPRRRHPGDAARGGGRTRVRDPGGRVPRRRAGLGGRGVHVFLRARGDAGRRARRHARRRRQARFGRGRIAVLFAREGTKLSPCGFSR